MRYRRKTQITTILILVAVIASISIGFAAFSATLNISSSATVTPNSDNFSIVFSSSQYVVNTTDNSGTVVNGIGTNGAQGGITNLYRKQATGLTAQFTEPGQILTTTIYAHNIGEYDAYLRGVNIENIGNSYKKCIAATGTTDSLVQSACAGIKVSINVGGVNYEYGSLIAGHVLSKDSVEPIVITVSYEPNSARADGDFDIEFGDITLEYGTVDNTSNKQVITFSIDGPVQAEDGMTFAEWIRSSYNTIGVKYDNNGIIVNSDCIKLTGYLIDLNSSTTITEGSDFFVLPYGNPNRNGTCY